MPFKQILVQGKYYIQLLTRRSWYPLPRPDLLLYGQIRYNNFSLFICNILNLYFLYVNNKFDSLAANNCLYILYNMIHCLPFKNVKKTQPSTPVRFVKVRKGQAGEVLIQARLRNLTSLTSKQTWNSELQVDY